MAAKGNRVLIQIVYIASREIDVWIPNWDPIYNYHIVRANVPPLLQRKLREGGWMSARGVWRPAGLVNPVFTSFRLEQIQQRGKDGNYDILDTEQEELAG